MRERPPELPLRPKGPLSGVRVLDLTQVWAGPRGTQILAALGAEVIKIEAPTRPDPQRTLREKQGYFHSLNRNKLGVALDLSDPRGKEVFLDLVAVSDVVAENFSARVMPNLGLDYRVLVERNPALVVLSMPALGLSGPEKNFTGWGDSVEAMAGLSSITGYDDGPPMISTVAYTDPVAGVNGAMAVVMALFHRKRTGKGCHIDLSQLEALAPLFGRTLLDYQMNERAPEHQGNRDPGMAPHGTYRCKGDDSWVAIAVRDDGDWRQLVLALESPAWAIDPSLELSENRIARAKEIDSHIEQWTCQRTHTDVMRLLQGAGVPSSPVYRVAEVGKDPHIEAMEVFESVEWKAGQWQKYVRPFPVRLSKEPPKTWRRAPAFGGDNDHVLNELLGLESGYLKQLHKDKVISYEFHPV